MYSIMDVDAEDIYLRVENLEIEKSILSQQVKDLENALNKQKVFHRKFVADVTDAEEMRIKDFNIETKELREENKRLKAENRVLAKEKAFYQAAYDSFTEDDDNNKLNARSNNMSQSTSEAIQHAHNTECCSTDFHPSPSLPQHQYNTRRSSTNFYHSSSVPSHVSINESAVHNTKNKSLKKVTRLSEKWFEDYKKMKLKLSKLSGDNKHLKLKVKKLENFKSKTENKKITQEAHRSELQLLSKQSVRTNEQIFNSEALAKLLKL